MTNNFVWNILILILSLFSVSHFLGIILLPSVFNTGILLYTDILISFVFLVDFIGDFFSSKNKVKFIRWGWIDLISCIPMIILSQTKILRIVRLVRVIRSIRMAKKETSAIFPHDRISYIISLFGVILIITIMFSSLILLVETREDCNIKNPSDALWWTITTVTTVGYGDRFPVTDIGRLIGGVLMIIGVGFFGTLSGIMGSFIIEQCKK